MPYGRLLVDQIKQTLLNSAGRLNSAVIRRDSFKTSDLHADVIQSTSWMPADAPLAQRVDAILNDMHLLPQCSCGNSCDWTGYTQQRYRPTCGSRECVAKSKSTKTTGRANTAVADKYNARLQMFLRRPVTEINDLPRHCKSITSQVYLDADGVFVDQHTTQVLRNAVAAHYNPVTDNVRWAHVLYDTRNNISSPPLCEVCSSPLTFRNAVIGYSGCKDKTCAAIAIRRGKSRINSNKQVVVQSLYDSGLDVAEFPEDGLNAGPIKMRCRVCDHVFERKLHNANWKGAFCPSCYPNHSQLQQEMFSFVSQLAQEAQANAKLPNSGDRQQLDILVPSCNLAIECNGVFWHCDYHDRIDKWYHHRKTKLCADAGVQLLHIWESEWTQQQPIVRSMIRARLGCTTDKIAARKCELVTVDRKSKRAFLTANHLQGDDRSQLCYGLVHDGQLVSVATFGHRKITGGDGGKQWELVRFCSKLDTVVQGALSKLFTKFVRDNDPETVVTYSDLRYGVGNGYTKIGFQRAHDSDPGYWYLVGNQLKHRAGYMKHLLHKRLEKFEPYLTEVQNMANNGFYRVWDCGHAVFHWHKLSK